jgi:4'-phosphopantetheinyl transferase
MGKSVGVDCEMIRENIEIESISRDNFSPIESQCINSLDPSERLEAFYRCWTRKEAFVKATGQGMLLSFSGFTVSVRPDEPASIIHINNNIFDLSQWTLGDIDQIGIPAAFAIHSPSVTMQFREFQMFPPLSRGQRGV